MNNKSVINGVLAMLLVFMLWVLAVRYFGPSPSEQQNEAQTAEQTETPAEPASPTTSSAPVRDTAIAATSPSSAPAGDAYTAVGGEPEEVVLGDDNLADKKVRPYPMEMELTTRGAAVADVKLSDYDQNVRKKNKPRVPYELIRPVKDETTGQMLYAMATESLKIIEGKGETISVDLEHVDWKLDEHTKSNAVFSVEVTKDGAPFMRVIKRFELPKQPREDIKGAHSGRHDVLVSLQFENLTDHPVKFSADQIGPTGMSQEMVRTDDRHIYAAYRNDNGVKLDRKRRSNVARKDISWDVVRDGHRLLWTAIDNQYFTCTIAPAGDPKRGFSDLIARVEARELAHHDSLDPVSDVAPLVVLAAQTLAAGGDLSLTFDCYFGPKSRPIFTAGHLNPDYVKRDYVAIIERNYSTCTFSWLTNIMIWLLTFFGHRVFGNYGVGIIVLVLIVRTLLHPLTVKQQISMTKMQRQMSTLQPKLEEIKKKYANDKAKQNEETMKLYRESGINPAGQMLTCLPMLIQMPIWVALWTSLNSSIEMRHAPFVFWIRDLTAPDALYTFAHPFTIPLLSAMIGPIYSLNLLPILLAITMYAQQKLMPKASRAEKRKSQTPDQLAQQQKMMSFMLVFFGVLFYNAPSGLNLYIMASNIFGMLEQWRVRQHIKSEDLKGKMDATPKKSKLVSGWVAKLEKMADDAKKRELSKARRK